MRPPHWRSSTTDARFNNPRANPEAGRFKVMYASKRLFTSLWEAPIRDDMARTEEQYIARRVLDAVRVVSLRGTVPLSVLDIRENRYLEINASPDIVKTRHKNIVIASIWPLLWWRTCQSATVSSISLATRAALA